MSRCIRGGNTYKRHCYRTDDDGKVVCPCGQHAHEHSRVKACECIECKGVGNGTTGDGVQLAQ